MQQKRRRLRRTRKATPPTVPPAIAPVWDVDVDWVIGAPPADEPPTPATPVDAEAEDEVAEVLDVLDVLDVELELEVEVEVADEGEVEFMQLVPPDCTVKRPVEPPVMYGPESLMRSKNCVPDAMSTVKS
jgi:hypothetical protein